ncbi:hypothetical protein Ae201684P_020297 [Aphanomyces euteiches]|nr:hypothetical protein Ae201684P_020297 [Aphanomyces euteiches]
MDETSFSPSTTSEKVVVSKDTKNPCTTDPQVSDHITVVACVGDDGSKIPPLFIFPGTTVTTEVCDSLSFPGSAVTTSKKGWINSFICNKWLAMFNDAVPPSTRRPILLILDGCSSHFSHYIAQHASSLGILLLFFPANSTHILQPLDVTVFRPFKQAVRQEISDQKWIDGSPNVSKTVAVDIGCRVWAERTKMRSIVNGFGCTGLWPPWIDKMMYRLSLFKPKEELMEVVKPIWMERVKAIQKSVFLLPVKPASRRSQRKTLTVSGKLITAEYRELLESQANNAKRKKQAISSFNVIETAFV